MSIELRTNAEYWAPGMLYCLKGFDEKRTPFNQANVEAWAVRGLGDWKNFCEFLTCDDPFAFNEDFDNLLVEYAHKHWLAADDMAARIRDLMKWPNPEHVIDNWMSLVQTKHMRKHVWDDGYECIR